jgi:hypothetical protein
MHQLGPPQRVPSLVEARRTSLAKSDTLFTHPYVSRLRVLFYQPPTVSAPQHPWSAEALLLVEQLPRHLRTNCCITVAGAVFFHFFQPPAVSAPQHPWSAEAVLLAEQLRRHLRTNCCDMVDGLD